MFTPSIPQEPGHVQVHLHMTIKVPIKGMRLTWVSLSRLLLILGVLQVRLLASSFPSFTGKLEVLATFLMLADLLMLVGDDGELPAAISASSAAADELFVDFLNVPGGLPLPKWDWEWEVVDFLNVPGGLPLPKPRFDSEE